MSCPVPGGSASRSAHHAFQTLRPLLAVLIALVFGSSVQAAEFRCATGNLTCLIEAINVSNGNGDSNTIRLDAGTYSLTGADNFVNGPLTSTPNAWGNGFPVITGRIVISGVTADRTIIERANYLVDVNRNLFRFLVVAASGQLTLEHLTLRGGNVGLNGDTGAILSFGSLKILDSIISDNSAATVASLTIAGGTLTLRDSRLQNNNAVGLDGTVLNIGSSIAFPSPPGSVSATIERTTIADNGANQGVLVIGGSASVLVIDSAVVRNHAGDALAGVIAAGGPMTVWNSTIADNTAAGRGTAVIHGGADSLIANSTIVNPRHPIEGNVIDGGVRLQNSILVPLVPANVPFPISNSGCDSFTSLGHNLIFGYPQKCSTGLLASDLTGDPGLAAFVDGGRPGAGHFPLLASSGAIDAGDPAVCPQTDQRLLARPIDGNGDGVRGCDIGAVEFYPTVNDRLQLAAVNGRFQPAPANPDDVNRLAAGGAFQIDGTFINLGATNLCHVAFEVTTLSADTATVTLLAPDGNPLGQAGVTLPATALGTPADLALQGEEHYHFTIGVSRPEAISFFVNVLGEPFAGSCAP